MYFLPLFLLILSGCKFPFGGQSSYIEYEHTPFIEAPQAIALSIQQLDAYSIQLNWNQVSRAKTYTIEYMPPESSSFLTASTQANTGYRFSAFTTYGSYRFRIKATNSSGSTISVEKEFEVVLPSGSTPPVPQSIRLIDPAATISADKSPTISVFGVVPGQTVSVFTDAICLIEVGRGVVSDNQVSVTMTLSDLSDGEYNFYAKSRDASFNYSSCSDSLASYVVDTLPPAISLSSPPKILAANVGSYSFSGTCSENGRVVSLNVGAQSFATSCAANVFEFTNLNLSSLGDGNVTFAVSQTDFLGNLISVNEVILKDATGPTVSLNTTPNINSTNVASYQVSGACSENAQNVEVSIGTYSAVIACSSNLYSISGIDLSLQASGAINIQAKQRDANGNETSISSSVVKDVLAPSISVTAFLNITNSNKSAFSLSGACSENGRSVTASVSGLHFTSYCVSGVYSFSNLNVSSLGDGLLSWVIQISDVVGNSSSITQNILKDTVVPTVTLATAPAVTGSNVASYSVSGGCSENSQAVSISIGSYSTTTACGGGTYSKSDINLSNLSDGNLTIQVNHSDIAGNPSGAAAQVVLKDTTAPSLPNSIALIDPASTVSSDSSPAIRVTGVTAADTVFLHKNGTCSDLVGTATVGISQTSVDFNLSGLTDGTYSFYAKSQDIYGNTSICSVVFLNYTVDTAVPTLTLQTPPILNFASSPIYSLTGTCSENSRPITLAVGGLSFSSTCSGGIFTLSSLNLSSLPEGNNNFNVSIADLAGNSATATQLIFKDAISPTLTLGTLSSISTANETNYSLSGTCSENGSNVEIQIGTFLSTSICSGGAFGKTGIDLSEAAQGTITVQVRQTDAFQNLSSLSQTTIKDTILPELGLSTPTSINQSNQTNYTISGSCGASGRPVTAQSGAISYSTICMGGAFTFANKDLSSLSDGIVNWVFETSDDVGNTTTLNETILKDTLVPIVSLDPAPSVTPSNVGSYSISGTCSEATQAVIIQISSLNLTVVCSTGSFSKSGIDLSSLADGALTIQVGQSDIAGNSAISVTQSISKDTTAPSLPSGIALINPTATPSMDTTPTVRVAGVAASDTVTLHKNSTCSDQVASGVVGAGQSTVDLTSTALGDGLYSFYAKSQDSNGNASLCSIVFLTYTVDTTSPTLTINSPAVLNLSSVASYNLTGTCSENGRLVGLSVGGLIFSSTCSGGGYSISSFDVTSLPEGNNSFVVTLVDLAGNSTSSIQVVFKDVTPPSITVGALSNIILSNMSNYGVSGSCSENGLNVEISISSYATTVACSAGFYSKSGIDLTAIPQGAVSVRIRHIDAAGNSVEVSQSINKVIAAPILTMSSPSNILNSNKTTYSISGSCGAEGRTVTISVGALSFSAVCTLGSFSILGMDVSTLLEGNSTWSLTTSDSYGNTTSITQNIFKDTVLPSLTLTASNISASNEGSYSLSGACSENAQTISIQIGSFQTSSTCSAGAFSKSNMDLNSQAEGVLAVQLSLSDLAGNQFVLNQDISKDSIAPSVPSTITLQSPASLISQNRTPTVRVGGVSPADTVSLYSNSTCSTLIGSAVVGAGQSSVDITTSNLPDASYQFYAKAVDGIGNNSLCSIVFLGYTVDNSNPSLAITSPLVVNTSNVSSYALSGTCSENSQTVTLVVGALTFYATCTTGIFNFTGLNLSSLSQGNSTYTATLYDVAGNFTQAIATINKDTAAPTLSLVTLENVKISNQSSYTLAGACSENSRAVSIQAGTYTSSATCTSGAFNKTNIDLSSLSDGAISVQVTHSDANGNSSTVSQAIIKDTTAPSIGLSPSNGINNANKSSYALSGTCSESGQLVTAVSGSLSFSATCSAGVFTFSNLDVTSLSEGSTSWTIETTDVVGNSGVVVQSIGKDTINPALTFSTLTPITNSNYSSYSISGSCSDNGRDVALSIGSYTTTVTCTSNAYSKLSINLNALAEGSTLVQASLSDAAGNSVSISQSITKDTVLPTLSGVLDFSEDGASITQSTIFNWSGMTITDVTSGFVSMEVAVGTTAGGVEVMGWKEIPNAPVISAKKYQIRDGVDSMMLTLAKETNYFISLKVIDGVGNQSTVFASASWRIFDPTVLVGLEMWWDMSDSATLYSNTSCTTSAVDAGTVGCIKDKSSNNRSITSATGATYSPTNKSINFDGSVATYGPFNFGVTGRHVFTVFQPSTNISSTSDFTTTGGSLYEFKRSSSDPYAVWLGLFTSNLTNEILTVCSAQPCASWTGTGVSVPSSRPNILGVNRNSADAYYSAYLDGTKKDNAYRNTGSTAMPLWDASAFYLGNTGTRANGRYDGQIMEMVVFSSNLTNAQREKVEGYLACKWGSQSYLPTGHTYKTTCP